MKGENIYITRLCAWAQGIGSRSEWDEWALGKREISCDGKGPEISFTDSMFRRRLSRISKMTIQVIHDLLPFKEDTKIFFISLRGELSRQFQINKMLIEEKSLSPAAFSLSVFNAPAALATMALGLKGGYTALYPGNNSFASGIKAAQAALLCGAQEELCLVYADEQAPVEYAHFQDECPPSASFTLLLSRSSEKSRAAFPPLAEEDTPLDFLRRLLLSGEIHVSP